MHGEVVHRGNNVFLLLLAGREEEHHLAHIQHMGIKHTDKGYAVGSLLAAAPEDDETAFVLVGQEFEAFGAFERVDVVILLVEKDGVRFCKGVEGLQDRVHCCWAFRAVQ